MVRLVPHSLKIVALEDLAGRRTSVLAKNIEMPKSLCNGLRDGLGRSRRAQVVPVHLAHRGDRGIRIDPLQCQAPPLYEVVLDMAPRLRAALPAAGIDPAAVDQLVGLLRSLHAGNNDRRAGVNDLVYVVMRGWADVLRRARVARGSDRAAEDAYHELIKRVPRLPAARLGSDPHLLELRRALAMNGGLGMGGGLAVPPPCGGSRAGLRARTCRLTGIASGLGSSWGGRSPPCTGPRGWPLSGCRRSRIPSGSDGSSTTCHPCRRRPPPAGDGVLWGRARPRCRRRGIGVVVGV